MAMWASRSRSISHSLNSKIHFLEFFKQRQFSSPSRSSALPKTSISENCGNPLPVLEKIGALYAVRRFESTNAAEQASEVRNKEKLFLDGRMEFTSKLKFISEFPAEKVHCYRVLDNNGCPLTSMTIPQVAKDIAVKMYRDMVTLQLMDMVFYEAQRQGRISFYATTTAEEAINIASAAALTTDDVVLPQYREPGVLLSRGFTLQDFANQCFGNKADYGKGRQMPVHYGSSKYNYFTVQQQSRDGVAVKGQAYGIRSLKVDGNDALAVYGAVRAAREMAISEQRPILIEAMTYRVGHHSTSDDSSKYRPVDEIEYWREVQNPLSRFRKWMERNGWWSRKDEAELQSKVKEEVFHAIQVAERTEKAPLADLFTDVYDHLPSNLQEQEMLL
ncbi:2-oxoisovalerate dehydrogenase subunit alpha 1, mitochondrial-like isoform X2 [Diospyros lotus]|uniref:2-oxoisovalerate dehydrogenase subunit alpha 1, mitochondrial-like isoform X2 n=1 Tax=Diospyros lotus TaxID=55363 RepID=UPI00225A4298|nr:2-oxoisovalerate dehydrogenase subunit alpha 1, mitochondrial-like isoform X2 [Diospyros lotus]